MNKNNFVSYIEYIKDAKPNVDTKILFQLLNDACKLPQSDKIIERFCMEFRFGKDWEQRSCWDMIGKEIPLRDVSDLWDYVYTAAGFVNKNAEMSYDDISPVLLASGVYRRVPFYVVKRGLCPCCYLNVAGTNFAYWDEDEINEYIVVHGGVTYACNEIEFDNGWMIGWDYSHFGDYKSFDPDNPHAHKWSTDELVNECREAIDDLFDNSDQLYFEFG